MKSFRNSSVALACLLLAGAAFAGDNCNKGTCTTDGGNVATGGAGGTGVGIAGAAALAGAQANSVSGASAGVVGSGNSSNDIRNSNSSSNVNANSQRTDNTNKNNNLNSQGQGQRQTANGGSSNQSQSNSSANRIEGGNGAGNSTNVSVAGDTVTYKAAEIPVATAYATGLTASNGTCMGSTSAGAQGLQFGLSVGTTWTDEGCDLRYNAQALAAAGRADAALQLLTTNPKMAQAIKDADAKKAGRLTKAEADEMDAHFARAASKSTNYSGSATAQYTDPIIRSRLGLPPLVK